MLVNSSLDTLLNMFVRSAKIAARVGVACLHCGCWMNLSMDRVMAFIMKSMPPLMPTTKLKGSKYCTSVFHVDGYVGCHEVSNCGWYPNWSQFSFLSSAVFVETKEVCVR